MGTKLDEFVDHSSPPRSKLKAQSSTEKIWLSPFSLQL